MNLTKRILAIFVCCATLVAGSGSAMAAQNCRDKKYAAAHPEKCAQNARTANAAGILGAAAVVGAGALALNLANDAGTPAHDVIMPTLPSYTHVGDDVDGATLAGIMSSKQYAANSRQFDDIRMAWSMARGFTGVGSTIAVLDTDEKIRHGGWVASIASDIASGATIERHQVTSGWFNFLSYAEIGDVIAAATNANIFNASWSVEMRATEIRSREHFISVTDANFIDAIIDAADRDAIFVWAAGNDYSRQSSALSALPLFFDELDGKFINVVAWDSNTGRLADYSNQCGITKNYCITAPGTGFDINGDIISGTSFATPVVSAAIAILREAFPYLGASEITAILFTTARDLGAPGIDDVYGWGMLDLERATRPVGASLVPISGGAAQPLRTAVVSGAIGHKIISSDLKFAFVDGFGRAYPARLNDNIKIRNPGRGFAALTRRSDEIPVSVGPFDFGFSNPDFLTGYGFLNTDRNSKFGFMGVHGATNIGPAKLAGNIRVGFGAPRTPDDSMIAGFSPITTASAGVTAKIGDWEFAANVRDAVLSGDMQMRIPIGRANDGRVIFGDHSIDLAGTNAVEYSVRYKSLTVAFVDNPYGTDEIFLISRHIFKF